MISPPKSALKWVEDLEKMIGPKIRLEYNYSRPTLKSSSTKEESKNIASVHNTELHRDSKKKHRKTKRSFRITKVPAQMNSSIRLKELVKNKILEAC